MSKSNRHRATVIEVYNNGGSAAVQFASGRVEHVIRRGQAPDFTLGMRGMVDYVRTVSGYEWTFVPYKSS